MEFVGQSIEKLLALLGKIPKSGNNFLMDFLMESLEKAIEKFWPLSGKILERQKFFDIISNGFRCKTH